ncbi:hypothetical protein H5P28_05055 [Ruficoccus amylovorans]|uniref:Uncharacterized protein n=1 Tax=Ruficoccus amylovorans TaxID=1804625 RepID=A0A842HD59_9BACT|nr:hypothetical protein [Ruficoccus amylovorans]MBC2593626.1 hypothetical protein [Ruficoccus amylovorans]
MPYPHSLPCWLAVGCLAVLPLSSAHALFDNTCLLFNIASRDYPMPDNWLSKSLFALSAKKVNTAEMRNLRYEESENPLTNENDSGAKQNIFLVDGKIRFLNPEATTPPSPSAGEFPANPSASENDAVTSDSPPAE